METINTAINRAAIDTRSLDDCLGRLSARKDAWVRLSAAERVPFLRSANGGVLDVAAEWVDRTCEAKQVDPHSTLGGQDWVTGPMTTVRGLRLFAEALEAGGRPRPP